MTDATMGLTKACNGADGLPPGTSKLPSDSPSQAMVSEVSTVIPEGSTSTMFSAPIVAVSANMTEVKAPHSYQAEWTRTRVLKSMRRLLVETQAGIGALCMDQELATALNFEHTSSEAQVDLAAREAILNFCRHEYRLFEVVPGSEPKITLCPEWTPWWEVRDRATSDQDKLASILLMILRQMPLEYGPIHSDDLENVHEVYYALGGQRLGHVLPQDVEWRDLRISSVFGEPDCVTVALANQGEAGVAEATVLKNTWASIDGSGSPNPILKVETGGYSFEFEDEQVPLRLQLRSTKAGQASNLFVISIRGQSVLISVEKFLLWTQAAIALGPEALDEFITTNAVSEEIRSGHNSPAAEGTTLTTSSSSRPRNRRILAHFLRTSLHAKGRKISADKMAIMNDWKQFLEAASYSNPRLEEQRFVWAEGQLQSLISEKEVDEVISSMISEETMQRLPASAFHCLRIAVCDLHSGASGSPNATSTVTSETKALLSELKVEPIHISTIIAHVTKIAAKLRPDQVFTHANNQCKWTENCALALTCLEKWLPKCKDYKVVMAKYASRRESFPICEALLMAVTSQGEKLDKIDGIINESKTFDVRYRQRCLLRLACGAAIWVKEADANADHWVNLLKQDGGSSMDSTPQLEVVLREVINRARAVKTTETITVPGAEKISSPTANPACSPTNNAGKAPTSAQQEVDLVSEFLRANGPTDLHVVFQQFSKTQDWVRTNFDVRGTTVFLKLHQKRLFPSVYVSDIPSEWKEGQVREFLDKRVQHVESLRMLPSRRLSADTQACIVRFLTAEAAEIAVNTLKGVSVQTARGNKYIGARIAKPSKREQQQMGELQKQQSMNSNNNNRNNNNSNNSSFGNINNRPTGPVPGSIHGSIAGTITGGPVPGSITGSINPSAGMLGAPVSSPAQSQTGTVKIANVPSEWSEAYLRDFLAAQDVQGLQFCTMLAPKPGMHTCTAILKFNPVHHADQAISLIPTLSFKNSQGAFTNLEMLTSSPQTQAAPMGGFNHRPGFQAGFGGPKYSPGQPGTINGAFDANRNNAMQYGVSPHMSRQGQGHGHGHGTIHQHQNHHQPSPHSHAAPSHSDTAPADAPPSDRWCSDDLMNYLEQATSQIRENLTKGMTPSPSQLEKYVNKLVDRMQMKMKGAPFNVWDNTSQFFFPFWGFVSNSRIRDPSCEELLHVLEKLLADVTPHNTTLTPAPQMPREHQAPPVHGAPAQKRMRYDY